MNKPAIGALRYRLEIQTYREIASGDAETDKDWTTIATVWGNLEPITGLTYFDTKQIGEGLTHRVIIRYNKNINLTAENWIKWKGKRLRVRFVRNLKEWGRFLELLCAVEFIAIDKFRAGEDSAGEPLSQIEEE